MYDYFSRVGRRPHDGSFRFCTVAQYRSSHPSSHSIMAICKAIKPGLRIVGKQKRCMMNTSMLEAVLSAGFSQVVKN